MSKGSDKVIEKILEEEKLKNCFIQLPTNVYIIKKPIKIEGETTIIGENSETTTQS